MEEKEIPLIVFYNGRNYRKHTKQKYYYVSRKGKNYSRCLHRQMWFDAYGEIPKGMAVHHKDDNSYNNTIENFELKERGKHQSDHMKDRVKNNPEYFKQFAALGRAKAPLWHKSEEGRKWHSEHSKKMIHKKGYMCKPKDFKEKSNCPVCNKEFIIKSYHAKFCSNNCKSEHRRRLGVDNEKRNCVMCTKEFTIDKYADTKTCSRSCAMNLQWSKRKSIKIVSRENFL